MNEPVYAYWIHTRGPLGPGGKGAELHYVASNEHLHENVRGDKLHFTPSIDWWLSEEAFEDGRKGFSNSTHETVQAKYPGLVILESQQEAVAWYYFNAGQESVDG